MKSRSSHLCARAVALVLAGLMATSHAVADPERFGASGNDTLYSGPLKCLAQTARVAQRGAPRIAVGRIGDLTGKIDLETGTKVTQGASLFAITALGKAGVPVVERLDSSVSESEINYSRQHLLSDTPEKAGIDPDNYRRLYAGQVAGSRYYIVGGVTELNTNIASSGINGAVGRVQGDGLTAGGSVGHQDYVLNVAVDLRLVDSRSQQVVDMASYQTQVRGQELDLGLSGRVSGRTNGVISGGTSAMDPLQAAVRSLVERGVFDLVEFAYFERPGVSGCLG